MLKISVIYGKICKKGLRKIDKLDFEIDEKVFKKLLIIGVVFIIIYLTITFFSFAIPRVYRMDKDTVEDVQGTVQTGINILHRGSMRLELSGWAYKQGQSIERFESYFILKNKENGRMYLLNCQMEQMPELQFVDGYHCLNCGLHSQSIVLGLKNGDYDLYILYKNDNENLLVNTDVVVEI